MNQLAQLPFLTNEAVAQLVRATYNTDLTLPGSIQTIEFIRVN
jgi:hypothetical protein